ncbi:uncharacterized protein LOC125891173 isoform X5 [Epinephelus fuscoguttatus]|uniref:uncharacterized protein LOC125891173 isoform X5 n=1 Tax=Epinephelus fuscoguttatus TaxID=293821 RepID=UPI0020D0AC1A|nr:uncharacterized protein LOC125891173 isoform X5 [Epinephelus fuscoguttatus]
MKVIPPTEKKRPQKNNQRGKIQYRKRGCYKTWKKNGPSIKGIVNLPDACAEGQVAVKASAGISVGAAGLVEIMDTYDRPSKTLTAGTYADAGTFLDGFEDKPGKRFPKAGVYAGAGLGLARAQWSVFEAQAKGPNASVVAEASSASLSVKACAKAEVASVSATAGPVNATLGLAFDIGASVSPTCIEAKVLGTGFSVGSKVGFSLFGTGFEMKLW